MSRTMARIDRRGKRIPIACEPPPPVAVVGSLALTLAGPGAALLAAAPESLDVAFVAEVLRHG